MADSTPPVCDLTSAPDTLRQRFDEYARLFAAAFVARERTRTAVRWSLRAAPGIEEWARDLAVRENACCAFLTNTVTVAGDRVLWEITSTDDPPARAVLDLFYALPESPPESSNADVAGGMLHVVDQSTRAAALTRRRGGG